MIELAKHFRQLAVQNADTVAELLQGHDDVQRLMQRYAKDWYRRKDEEELQLEQLRLHLAPARKQRGVRAADLLGSQRTTVVLERVRGTALGPAGQQIQLGRFVVRADGKPDELLFNPVEVICLVPSTYMDAAGEWKRDAVASWKNRVS
jgi:hypothetical protein